MKNSILYLFLLTIFFFVNGNLKSAVKGTEVQHPCLILQKSSVPELIEGLKKYLILNSSFEEAKKSADQAIQRGIIVPVPKDPAGGYTHEQHTSNYTAMFKAAQVYQLTGDKKYAVFVRDMLLAYAKLYPTLGLHPEHKNSGSGKLFWQGLNDSVWLVYAIQAYDCVYDFISEADRANIESNLFEKIVHFFTVEDNYSFNLVHNHGTWSVAGVGMAGIVMNRPEWVQKALYSTKLDSSGGFIRQIKDLFSPDGYYAEGPYYQRYALLPFMVFAQALANNLPELKIFEYKNGVLNKAVNMLMQLTNTDGRFYPFNDAMKEKSWITPEMVFASNITYANTADRHLLDVASKNGTVMLSLQGLKVAQSIAEGKTLPFERKSVIISDGADGKDGGLALLRTGNSNDQTSVLFKFASQGMGHGHFDRLSFMLYDSGNEIVSDYGSARFLNVEAKDGGRYLNENSSWAKQTVAHNTMVLDGKSDFEGKVSEAEKDHPVLLFSDIKNSVFQIVSAVDSNCYKGAVLRRTIALSNNKYGRFLIDLYKVDKKDGESVCDIPIYYKGQIMSANYPYQKSVIDMKVLGKANGYQHLWVEATSNKINGMASTCWMTDKKFYTWSILGDQNSELYFTRIGANDPNFNLRAEPGLIFRQKAVKNHTFLNVLEMHGNYNPGSEAVTNSDSSLKNMEIVFQNSEVTCIRLVLKNGGNMILLVASQPDERKQHVVKIEDKEYKWEGNYKLITN